MPVSTRFCLGIVRESSFLLSADPNAGGCALEGLLFAYPAPGLRHPRLKVPRPAEPSQEEPGSRCFLSRPPRNRLRPTTSSVRYTQRTCVRRSLVWSVLAGAQDPDSRKSKRVEFFNQSFSRYVPSVTMCTPLTPGSSWGADCPRADCVRDQTDQKVCLQDFREVYPARCPLQGDAGRQARGRLRRGLEGAGPPRVLQVHPGSR